MALCCLLLKKRSSALDHISIPERFVTYLLWLQGYTVGLVSYLLRQLQLSG
jgi:hypothetical protein